MNPNHVKTLCALATLERRSDHHKAAKVHLRKALVLQPTNPVALRVRSAPLQSFIAQPELQRGCRSPMSSPLSAASIQGHDITMTTLLVPRFDGTLARRR